MPTYVVPIFMTVHCPGDNKKDAARRAVDALNVAGERRCLLVFKDELAAGPMVGTDGEAISLLVTSVEELNDALRGGHLELVVDP